MPRQPERSEKSLYKSDQKLQMTRRLFLAEIFVEGFLKQLKAGFISGAGNTMGQHVAGSGRRRTGEPVERYIAGGLEKQGQRHGNHAP